VLAHLLLVLHLVLVPSFSTLVFQPSRLSRPILANDDG
jgi:hypothetical protein